MARSPRRNSRATGPFVTPLEHHIPVNWYVVGKRKWLDEAWEAGALEDAQRIVITKRSDMTPVKTFLNSLRTCGVDTETAGPYKANDKYYSLNSLNEGTRVVLLQVGNQDCVYLIQPELIPEFKEYLESDQVRHVGHNLSYDFKWLFVKYGVHMQRMYCSMLAEQILTAGLMGVRVNLADSVRRRAPYWIINKAVRDAFVHFGHTSGCPDCEGGFHKQLTREMGYYAARDIVLLFPLMREQVREIKHYRLERVAQVEFDIIPATAEMELGGVDLSLPVMRQVIEYWTQREKELADEFFAIYSEEQKKAGKESNNLLVDFSVGFNLKSGPAKLAALRELDIDLDNIQRSTLKNAVKGKIERKAGKRTIEITLDLTPTQRRLLEIFAEISNVFKMTSTYGKKMVDKISPVTGRWHPTFKQLGSGEEEGRRSGGEDKATIATGRFSSNAQQFPKPKEEFAAVRAPKEVQQVMLHFANEIAATKALTPAA